MELWKNMFYFAMSESAIVSWEEAGIVVRVRRGIGILMLVDELLFFLLQECP